MPRSNKKSRSALKAATAVRPRADKDHVQSLERGLAVIRCLGSRPKLTLTQVATMSGMTRAAARRFLITLENLGYVGRSDTQFLLLPRTLELGYAFLSSQTVPQLVQPHLERLAHALQETCSVMVLDGQSIRYIARVTTNRLMGPALSVGSILPAYCTAAGRVLLAALPEDKLDAYLRGTKVERFTAHTIVNRAALRKEIKKAARQGWYLSDQETDAGVRALAAPLHDANNHVIAALNVSCYLGRVEMARMTSEFLPRLLEVTAAVDNELKASGLS